ncbi:MAG: hypothetical protein C0622_13880, partial [Desulfuromonas sp.]
MSYELRKNMRGQPLTEDNWGDQRPITEGGAIPLTQNLEHPRFAEVSVRSSLSYHLFLPDTLAV